jgi:thioredoxin 1
MATVVTDATYDEEVAKSAIPVMIDFFAEWCGPCKQLTPIVEELAGEWEGKVKIVKLNVDDSQETAQKFGVMSIPTLVFLKDGEEVDRVTGALPKTALEEKLKAL